MPAPVCATLCEHDDEDETAHRQISLSEKQRLKLAFKLSKLKERKTDIFSDSCVQRLENPKKTLFSRRKMTNNQMSAVNACFQDRGPNVKFRSSILGNRQNRLTSHVSLPHPNPRRLRMRQRRSSATQYESSTSDSGSSSDTVTCSGFDNKSPVPGAAAKSRITEPTWKQNNSLNSNTQHQNVTESTDVPTTEIESKPHVKKITSFRYFAKNTTESSSSSDCNRDDVNNQVTNHIQNFPDPYNKQDKVNLSNFIIPTSKLPLSGDDISVVSVSVNKSQDTQKSQSSLTLKKSDSNGAILLSDENSFSSNHNKPEVMSDDNQYSKFMEPSHDRIKRQRCSNDIDNKLLQDPSKSYSFHTCARTGVLSSIIRLLLHEIDQSPCSCHLKHAE